MSLPVLQHDGSKESYFTRYNTCITGVHKVAFSFGCCRSFNIGVPFGNDCGKCCFFSSFVPAFMEIASGET